MRIGGLKDRNYLARPCGTFDQEDSGWPVCAFPPPACHCQKRKIKPCMQPRGDFLGYLATWVRAPYISLVSLAFSEDLFFQISVVFWVGIPSTRRCARESCGSAPQLPVSITIHRVVLEPNPIKMEYRTIFSTGILSRKDLRETALGNDGGWQAEKGKIFT